MAPMGTVQSIPAQPSNVFANVEEFSISYAGRHTLELEQLCIENAGRQDDFCISCLKRRPREHLFPQQSPTEIHLCPRQYCDKCFVIEPNWRNEPSAGRFKSDLYQKHKYINQTCPLCEKRGWAYVQPLLGIQSPFWKLESKVFSRKIQRLQFAALEAALEAGDRRFGKWVSSVDTGSLESDRLLLMNLRPIIMKKNCRLGQVPDTGYPQQSDTEPRRFDPLTVMKYYAKWILDEAADFAPNVSLNDADYQSEDEGQTCQEGDPAGTENTGDGEENIWDILLSEEDEETIAPPQHLPAIQAPILSQSSPLPDSPTNGDQSIGNAPSDESVVDLRSMKPPPTQNVHGSLLTFGSEDEAFEWDRNWAYTHGYAIQRRNMSKRKDGTPSYRRVICIHFYRSLRRVAAVPATSQSLQCNFQFKIIRDHETGLWHNGYMKDPQQLHVGAYFPEHTNHPDPRTCKIGLDQLARPTKGQGVFSLSSTATTTIPAATTMTQDLPDYQLSTMRTEDHVPIQIETNDEPMDTNSIDHDGMLALQDRTAATTSFSNAGQQYLDEYATSQHQNTIEMLNDVQNRSPKPQRRTTLADLELVGVQSLKHFKLQREEERQEIESERNNKRLRDEQRAGKTYKQQLRIDVLAKENRSLTSLVESLKKQATVHIAEAENSESALSLQIRSNTDLLQQAGQSEADRNSLFSKVQVLEEEIQLLKIQSESIMSELNVSRIKCDAVEQQAQQFENLKRKSMWLQQALEDTDRKNQALQVSLEVDIKDAKDRAGRLQQKVESLMQDNWDLDSENTKLRQERDDELGRLKRRNEHLLYDNAGLGIQLALTKGIEHGDADSIRAKLPGGKVSDATVSRLMEENRSFNRHFVHIAQRNAPENMRSSPSLNKPLHQRSPSITNTDDASGAKPHTGNQGKRCFRDLSLSRDGFSVIESSTAERQEVFVHLKENRGIKEESEMYDG